MTNGNFMSSDDIQFRLLTVGEMRAKFYSPNEQTQVLNLSTEKVPEPLRPLIPLAARWGISDDILRNDIVRRASQEELKYLKAAISHFDDELDEWLAGSESLSRTPSQEYLAFSNMRMAADGC